MVLTAYVHMVSQPSRALAWLLKGKGIEHDLVQCEFGSDLLKSNEYLAMNPNGYLPIIKDGEVALFEANAILPYVAEKYGHDDLYPSNLQTRAKINQYLHWHHTNVHNFTTQVLRPHSKRSLGIASPAELELIPQAQATIAKTNTLMEKLLTQAFIATNEAPSVAEYAAYCEYGMTSLKPRVSWSRRSRRGSSA